MTELRYRASGTRAEAKAANIITYRLLYQLLALI